MGILRIYPEKSNTIASGFFQHFNSGQNAVSDIWYGGGENSSLKRRNSISRYMLKFDLSDLESKINNKEINADLVKSYKLKIKNSIPKDRILEPEYEFDVLDKNVAASFDLLTFPINKDWDNGRGYDLGEQNYLVKQKGNPSLTGYSNWNFAKQTVAWDEPGIYSNPTASTAVTSYVTQHFDIGNEDINMDITDMVKDWLSGGSQNNGLAISYTTDFESLSSDTRFISSFFTEKTNSAFKPYIEVDFNQIIKDDRNQVSNDRVSRLFLYTFSGNSAVNYFSAGTVTIKNAGTNADVFTGLTPTQMEKGVYYIDVWMSGATRGQTYKDVWNGISFTPGVDQQDITQRFVIKDSYYLNNTPDVNNYSLSTYGLDSGSIVSNEEILRVFVDLRVNYSTQQPKTAYDLQYRMVMNNQDEVIPWSSVNQAIINKCPSDYFLLDTSWLLHNQTYEIQFKINEFGTSRVLNDNINFRVLRPF